MPPPPPLHPLRKNENMEAYHTRLAFLGCSHYVDPTAVASAGAAVAVVAAAAATHRS